MIAYVEELRRRAKALSAGMYWLHELAEGPGVAERAVTRDELDRAVRELVAEVGRQINRGDEHMLGQLRELRVAPDEWLPMLRRIYANALWRLHGLLYDRIYAKRVTVTELISAVALIGCQIEFDEEWPGEAYRRALYWLLGKLILEQAPSRPPARPF